ncbi:MAG TPA: hypothetical protein VGS97_26090 [Actinocrinis sp.]|uniref:hypothetical protein n=1 Tax=Actinocrinis sp. TaxID=1920516 RepID=UPI002DDD8BA8|nr:hypothetical protein [Actinocrinis sp.]HEV2347589.1 hypothetical protein [Actinocrinis sp.]
MARRAPTAAPAPAAPAAAGGPQSPAPAAATLGAGVSMSGGRSTSRQFNAPGWAPTAGGIVLGVLADILFVQYMRGGWSEVKAWLGAKFLNQVTGSAVGGGSGAGGAVGNAIGRGATQLGQLYGGGSGGASTAPSPGHPAEAR